MTQNQAPTTRFIGIRDLTSLTNYVKLQTGNVGLNVVFDPNCKVPNVTRKTMTIPAPAMCMTDEDVAKLRGAVIHECNHIRHGPTMLEDDGPAGKVDPKSPFFALINMIEDTRIDRIQAKRYVGDAIALSESHRILGKAISDKVTKYMGEGGLAALSEDVRRVSVATVAASEAQDDWNVGLGIGLTGYHKALRTDPLTAPLVEKILGLGYAERIRTVGSPEDVVNVARDLARDLGFDTSNMEGEQFAQGKGEQAEDAQEGGKGEGEENEADGDADGEDSGKPKKKGKSKAKPKDKLNIQDLVWSDHQKDSGWGNGSGMGFDWNTRKASDDPRLPWVPEPTHEIETVDYSGKRVNVRSHTGEAECLRSITKQAEGMDTAALTNNVRRYLQVRAAAVYNGGYKNGSLNTKALYRAAMPTIGNGDYNAKVFRRKEEHDILDCAVTLLVDGSGSMDGLKYVTAANAAVHLDMLFGNTLRIPCEIISFSTGGRRGRNMMGIIKAFNEKPCDVEIMSRFASFSKHMSGNGDPDAVLFAYNRIKDRNEKRKVLIVLSDGSPSFAIQGCADHGLRQVTQDIERSGVVELYGIGIQDSNVTRFYKNNVVINKVSDLDTKLVELLKSIILKGAR